MNLTTKMGHRLRHEHELLLACARVELLPAHRERIAALLQEELDWAFLHEEASHHRLIPLLHYHLGSFSHHACPTPILGRIRAEAHRIAVNGVRQTSELFTLVAAFADAGIPTLSLKGPLAAKSLYGNVGLRVSGDLDLLVSSCDAQPAFELLSQLGYEPQFSLSRSWRELYVRTNCELMFFRHRSRSCVDLHWGLIRPGYSFTPETDKLWERTVTVGLESKLLRTLGPEDSLAFYCIHAAKHDWTVLSCLLDITQFVQRNPDLDWEFVMSNAIAHGAQRFLSVSLQLARSLFEAVIPNDVLNEVGDDPCTHSLIRRVMSELLPAKARSAAAAPWPWRQPYFKAMCRIRDKTRYLHDTLSRPTPLEWQSLKLPIALSPLYYAVRPLRLMWRQIGRLARRVNPSSGKNKSLDT